MHYCCVLTLTQVLGMKCRFTWLKRAGGCISSSKGKKISEYVSHKSCYVMKNGLLRLKHEQIPSRRHEKEWRSRKVHGGRTGNLWLYHALSALTETSVLRQSVRMDTG